MALSAIMYVHYQCTRAFFCDKIQKTQIVPCRRPSARALQENRTMNSNPMVAGLNPARDANYYSFIN